MTETELVTLMIADNRMIAETTVALLNGYGLYAIAAQRQPKNEGIPIHVADSDLDDARALLADIERENAEHSGSGAEA